MKVTLIYFSRNAQPVASATSVENLCRESLIETCIIHDQERCVLNSPQKYFLLMVANVDDSVTNISRVYFFNLIILSHFSKKKKKNVGRKIAHSHMTHPSFDRFYFCSY